jgi:hypothetical protein
MQVSEPDLDFTDRSDLRPFGAVYCDVILQEAARARKWPLGKRKRAWIASAIETGIRAELGHPLHAAITCFALRICCHFHQAWAEELKANRDWTRHRVLIDRAWRLIQTMEEHYGVQRLKTLCY